MEARRERAVRCSMECRNATRASFDVDLPALERR